jgi:uncharacterized protein YodC (DUF2158 family)
MPDELKVGDTVKLKSGGPIMTTATKPAPFNQVKSVECTWFDGKKLNRGRFPVDALEPADPNREPVL